MSPCSFTPSGIFQLTPSRRATEQRLFFFCSFEISTHALTEGDATDNQLHGGNAYFNSRPHGGRRTRFCEWPSLENFNSRPHGGRHQYGMTGDDGFIFQLTPSRRATERRRDDKRREGISTHALTEGDRKRCAAESHTGISTHALTEGDPFVTLMTL